MEWVDDISLRRMNAALRDRILSRGSLSVEGTKYPYAIIQRDLPGAPRWFVGLHEESGVYIISSEIDEESRELILRHEMYESGFLNGKGTGRCERALFYEFAHCPAERLEQHIASRAMMFNSLLGWTEEPPQRDSYPAERREEMRRTFARLTLMPPTVR